VQTNADGLGLDEKTSRGFIAPFNAQVNLAKEHLAKDYTRKTVHKFQGRECDEIVFSTVLDKKKANQSEQILNFVDDPNLVNVAVSRAKKRFTLVTGEDIFQSPQSSISALIRYMRYYAGGDNIHQAPLVSAFDLLYEEYDASLETLRKKLNLGNSKDIASEQIVCQRLKEILAEPSLAALTFHREIALNKLVSLHLDTLTDDERTFMRNLGRCDIVLYFKVGKQPIAVIEVDGDWHRRDPEQVRRDQLKNSILRKAGLPLLRLDTDSAN